ncbi:Sec63 complex subunit SEC66 KNAG_0A03420 [Huiozyma naganishii CBS 8797]|uniref:Uncharacterized protein n=1 Tax=Huiozyma naganishii (strain ATCC MYA-139 / BCRC 22969 / CBS 8797 / KCTC 17520 / NBRC 10181 / NCYC 3082 / Yp74L-3) TaxID=1071383 RepID=J7QZU7_HUIN7|nr:hypothetical protein KNAG_0A03420 [Kazachstania naganishii CBS 8797]CCK68025.1 hypothetical protein KNAG_0A03420 [Kazachstania naganishii CBS 8797]
MNSSGSGSENGTFFEDAKFGQFYNGTAFNGTGFNGTGNGTASGAAEETVKLVATSVYTPFVYGAVLLVSLVFFARWYRGEQIKQLQELGSIFDEHDARDLYYELQATEKVHEKVLKAALLNRGAESVRRSFKMKELAPQVESLYKSGSVGEEYWKRFQTELKLIELEFKECLMEAEQLQPGWAQLYVALCQEICFNQAMQRRYHSILDRKNVCIEEWELNIDDTGRLKQ